jgi:hypothetical protein
MKQNSYACGSIKAGQPLTWCRSPGLMRLQVIAPNGDQAFAVSFQIE